MLASGRCPQNRQEFDAELPVRRFVGFPARTQKQPNAEQLVNCGTDTGSATLKHLAEADYSCTDVDCATRKSLTLNAYFRYSYRRFYTFLLTWYLTFPTAFDPARPLTKPAYIRYWTFGVANLPPPLVSQFSHRIRPCQKPLTKPAHIRYRVRRSALFSLSLPILNCYLTLGTNFGA